MRKSRARKREIVPDPRFNDVLVSKVHQQHDVAG